MKELLFVKGTDTETIKLVTSLAEQVRDEIVGADSPNNRCGLASVRLVEVIKENGIWGIQVQGKAHFRTFGGKRLCLNHKWVRVGELFVDVTLDQFNNSNKFPVGKVVVSHRRPRYLTCPENWYDKLYGCEYDPYREYLIDTFRGREHVMNLQKQDSIIKEVQ